MAIERGLGNASTHRRLLYDFKQLTELPETALILRKLCCECVPAMVTLSYRFGLNRTCFFLSLVILHVIFPTVTTFAFGVDVDCETALLDTKAGYPVEFVWFVGVSASGKKTLMPQLRRDPFLRERFGITGSVSLHGVSFEGFDRVMTARERHVLVQWQVVDHNRIEQLIVARPNATHRFFIVYRPFGVCANAWFERGKKQNWIEPSNFESCWNQIIVPRFTSLRDRGFYVEVVDGREGKSWERRSLRIRDEGPLYLLR